MDPKREIELLNRIISAEGESLAAAKKLIEIQNKCIKEMEEKNMLCKNCFYDSRYFNELNLDKTADLLNSICIN
jgi:hypothetical protein